MGQQGNAARPLDWNSQPTGEYGPRPARASVERADDFDFAGPEYLELHAASSATAFQHPVWLQQFYRHLAPSRSAEKIVITLRDAGNGRLIGVAPLVRRRMSGIQLLEATDLGVSDYAAPVLAPATRAGLAADTGLRAAISSALPAYDVLRVRPIREEAADDWRMLLPGTIEMLDFGAHATVHGADYTAWRADKPGKSLLKRLDRAYKAIAKTGGFTLRRLTEGTEIRDGVERIQRLREGRFEGDPIQQNHVRDFYSEVAALGAEEIASIYELAIGGSPAGYVFGLMHRGRFHYLLIGCDYETYGKMAPGLVFYDRLIADWAGRGGEIFDFTIGDEPFKADFGTEPTRMFMLTHAPGWRGQLAVAALRAREQLRGLARRMKRD